MSIRLRFSLLFATAALIAIVSGAAALRAILALEESLASSRSTHDSVILTQDLEVALLRTSFELTSFLAGDDEAREAYEAARRDASATIEVLGERMRAHADRPRVDTIRAELDRYELAADRALFLAKRGEDDQAFRTMRRWIEGTLEPAIDREVSALVATFRDRSRTAREEAREAGRFALVAIAATSLALVGMVLLGSWCTRRWLVRPLAALGRATGEIAQGHYGRHVPVEGSDELGRLAREIESMSESIADFQRQLVEKERYAAVGEMTATVAHNIRNPLASMRALAQSSRGSVEDRPEIVDAMTTLMKTVDRTDRWLKDLLVALRPVKVDRNSEDLNAVLRDSRSALVDFARDQGVEIELDLHEDLPPIPIDRRKVTQAVISLLTNAVEASPRGGTVTIRSAPGKSGDDNVEIMVEDEGPGIPPEEREKVFNPDFTTKKNGTGWGLSLSQRIVFGHHGRIAVETAPGSGCRMRVELPVRTDELPSEE